MKIHEQLQKSRGGSLEQFLDFDQKPSVAERQDRDEEIGTGFREDILIQDSTTRMVLPPHPAVLYGWLWRAREVETLLQYIVDNIANCLLLISLYITGP